jgi:hypothetical protein
MARQDGSSCTPEFELLLLASRTELDSRVEDRICSLVEEGIEWGHLIYLARYHRVLELLYQSLRRVVPGAIKGDAENFLRNAAHRTVAYNVILLRELGRLYEEMRAEGIDMISFKGPLLAHVAYGNLGLRSSVDLDFLIRPDSLPRVEALLIDNGYHVAQRMTGLSSFQRKAYVSLARQITYLSPARGVGLDVHTAVLPPGYRYRFGFEDLRQRSRMATASGVSVPVFAAEDMIHLLCFHGVKNRWDQLKYVCDIAEFARSHADMQWDEVFARARKTRGESVLLHGLHLAHVLLQAPLPEVVTSRIERNRTVVRLAEIAAANLMASHDTKLEWRHRVEFYMRSQDGISNKARYVMYSVMRHVGGVIDI